MTLKFFLKRESVRGTHCDLYITWKRGLLSPEGVMAKSVLRADTGHKVEAPKEGILRILTEFLC